MFYNCSKPQLIKNAHNNTALINEILAVHQSRTKICLKCKSALLADRASLIRYDVTMTYEGGADVTGHLTLLSLAAHFTPF